MARPLVLILQVAYLLPGPVINFLFCFISFNIILLHVWGFLGSVAWALSRGGALLRLLSNATIQTEGLSAALLRTTIVTETFL
jgi:hypothetical protein